jgi:hypothetical protein
MSAPVEESLVLPDGTRQWLRGGAFHREDGPAIIAPDGTQTWCRNGLAHRTDGPAIVGPDGSDHWYRHGDCHRDDGPAITRADGSRTWVVNGVYAGTLSRDQYEALSATTIAAVSAIVAASDGWEDLDTILAAVVAAHSGAAS